MANVASRRSVSRQAEDPLCDDVALNLRRSADANGRRVKPGLYVGISSTLIPLCSGASGSVHTKVSNTSAS